MSKRERAEELFTQGYNCAQAVAGAFCEEIGLPLEKVVTMVSAFGGGMGRLREVCGACSGMAFVLGCLRGYHAAEDTKGKRELYALVREGFSLYKEKNGSYLCKELLGTTETGGEPATRSAEYYQKRPCVELVGDAAEITESLLQKQS